MIDFTVTEIAHDRFEVEIPDDCPYFEGHFPQVAVLPGVAQVGIVLQALGRPALREVVHLRLRHTVGPGDRLAITIRRDGDRAGFDIEREGERVAHGTLRVG